MPIHAPNNVPLSHTNSYASMPVSMLEYLNKTYETNIHYT